MTYDELLRGLWALGHAQGMRLGLERVEAAAERLGRPNLDHPAVHVAGTDGKGSTAHVASRILQRHGLRVGLTTSPHLHRLTERIRIDGDGIPRDELARLATEAEARLGSWADGSLTFFEVVTLLAFAVAPMMTLDRALLTAAVCAYLVIAIPIEERKLVAIFGKAYLDYRKRVPAVIPRVLPLRGDLLTHSL